MHLLAGRPNEGALRWRFMHPTAWRYRGEAPGLMAVRAGWKIQ
jgi:hypothetical protein